MVPWTLSAVRHAGAACSVVVVAALAAPGAHAAPSAADLAVTSVAPGGGWVVAGERLTVSDQVRNSGRSKARPSATRYWLSTGRRRGRGAVALRGRRTVRALGGRKRSRGKANLKVPPRTKLGSYYLIACADAGRRVRERSEKNNCRPSKTPIAVTPRPKPRSVRAVPDSAREVSQRVGAAGGTLTATAADGTRFTLAIPAGALIGDEQIAMTPLLRVDGFPLSGGMKGGVQLGPDGLALLRPAKLTVDSPGAPPHERQAGFAYSGAGDAFHLVPIGRDGAASTLDVRHFSGYGTGGADGAERSAYARDNPPSSPAAQAEQNRAAGAPQAQLDALAAAGYAQIRGLIQNRATLEQGVLLIPVYEGMSPLYAGLFQSLRQVDVPDRIRAHLREARTNCFARRDIAEAAWMVRIGNLAQIHAPSAINDVAEGVERCVRFEFGMEMTARHNVQVDISTVGARVAGLPVRLASGFAVDSLRGSKAIDVTTYRVEDFDCWRHTWNPQPQAPFQVTGVHFTNLNLRWAVPNQPAPQLAAVDVGIGSIKDEVTHTCPGEDGSEFTSVEGTYDMGMAYLLEQGGTGTRITGWRGSGSVFEAGVGADGGTDSYTGAASFTLAHSPAP